MHGGCPTYPTAYQLSPSGDVSHLLDSLLLECLLERLDWQTFESQLLSNRRRLGVQRACKTQTNTGVRQSVYIALNN